MRDTLFINARIIDPEAGREFPGSVRIRGGRIVDVQPQPDEAGAGQGGKGDAQPPADRIDCQGCCLAPGIIDIGVKVCEPGERHKESYRSAGLAAAAGGVTTIVTRPDTLPALDNPEALEFTARRAAASRVKVLPMAALTKGRSGCEMTEMGLLRDAGAVAFTDCDQVVRDTRIFARALHYAAQLGAPVVGHVQEPSLSSGAASTAGMIASLRGLPAVPALAERMGLERDLALVEMTGVKYHADQITTAAALPVLERARQKGLDITVGVSIHHLALNELDVADYRTFFKVKPPLRSEQDRQAVAAAVAEGAIDMIHSMHTPQDEESKRLPFADAASGAVGLETLLPAALRLVHGGVMGLPRLFAALSFNPARRLCLAAGRMRAGAPADLVLFDPDAPFVLDRFTLQSKCKNTPFDGQAMQGRTLGTWVDGVPVHQAPDSRLRPGE